MNLELERSSLHPFPRPWYFVCACFFLLERCITSFCLRKRSPPLLCQFFFYLSGIKTKSLCLVVEIRSLASLLSYPLSLVPIVSDSFSMYAKSCLDLAWDIYSTKRDGNSSLSLIVDGSMSMHTKSMVISE